MDGEFEVIDLEATLKNPLNQEALDDLGASEVSPSEQAEFDVQSSEVGWKEILRELKEAGETEMMKGLVKEYRLESQLAALENEVNTEETVSSASGGAAEEAVDDDEDWDDIFEQSLQGLPREELIDELVENSESLMQLELEIMTSEMTKSEKEGGDLTHDTFEEFDWSTNTAWKEFRDMVLEDYNEKKQARTVTEWDSAEGVGIEGEDTEVAPSTTTNFSTKSDFADLPSDWKDFDSKSAFQRDFKEDIDAWVPPSSGFVPSHTYGADEKHEEAEEKQSPEKETEDSADDLDGAIDWLQARRSRLGDDEPSKQTPTHMMNPEEAETFRHQNSQIPVVPYTLLTTSEVTASLASQGGDDIHIIDATEFDNMQGVGMGCEAMILVTGRNASHIRVLADSIVRNLKARKLNERGVVGAMLGVEGGKDIFTSKRSRNRAGRNGAVSGSRKVDDDWMVIDCDNIHVHIMEEVTRRCLNIEGIWDLNNPNSEGSKLRRVDLTDDDSVDSYVAENPIPEEYAAKIFNQGRSGRLDGWISGGKDRVTAIPVFQSKSFSEKWSGVSKTNRKKRRRKKTDE